MVSEGQRATGTIASHVRYFSAHRPTVELRLGEKPRAAVPTYPMLK